MSARRTAAAALAALLLATGFTAAPPATQTQLVSFTPDGRAATLGATAPSISADGRFVAFVSTSSDLVEGDTNGVADVFVRDLATGATRRASVASDGAQADGGSGPPAISGSGRFVAFSSEATNLVPRDTNRCFGFTVRGSCPDLFVHDLETGDTRRVSVGARGLQANGESLYPAISADGRYVAFASLAINLVTRDRNDKMDVFLHDTATGETSRVSVGAQGQEADSFSFAPTVSADGARVAFTSFATNLVGGDGNGADDVFVRDLAAATTVRVSVAADGSEAAGFSGGASLSADGIRVAFWSEGALVPGDSNGVVDAYVRDLAAGTVVRASVSSRGGQGDGPVTAPPSLSPDGRFVGFESEATNLVPGDRNRSLDVFLHDLTGGTTALVSATPQGRPGNGGSGFPWVSAGGCRVAFSSAATDLADVPGGIPEESVQVYVHGPRC